MNFKEIVSLRYAVKSFDGKEIEAAKILELKEILRLTPTSFNLQPWRIKIIHDSATKAKLKPASWNQPQITTCSHLFVFCAHTNLEMLADRLEERLIKEAQMPHEKADSFLKIVRQFISALDESERLAWAQKQIYIVLGNAMNGAKYLGFDSCPIEGFSPESYREILQLPPDLTPAVVMALGYANDSPRSKLRFHTHEMFF